MRELRENCRFWRKIEKIYADEAKRHEENLWSTYNVLSNQLGLTQAEIALLHRGVSFPSKGPRVKIVTRKAGKIFGRFRAREAAMLLTSLQKRKNALAHRDFLEQKALEARKLRMDFISKIEQLRRNARSGE